MHTWTCYDGFLFFLPDLRRIVELLTVLQESECDSCRDSMHVDIPLTTISLYTYMYHNTQFEMCNYGRLEC